jgi:hypothetical protein
MEAGVRRFCARYTQAKYTKDDTLTAELKESWDSVGYGVGLLKCDHDWFYAPEPRRMNPIINAALQVMVHKSYKGGLEGLIYKLEIKRNREALDRVGFLDTTKQMHCDIMHVGFTSNRQEVFVTIPAVNGVEKNFELVSTFLRAGIQCSPKGLNDLIDVKDQWPEYVLWPNHLLTFWDNAITQRILNTGNA